MKTLMDRVHDLDMSVVKPIPKAGTGGKDFENIANNIAQAKAQKKPIILMAGGHVIRAGIQSYLIDLMERLLL
ncbi:MAG: hypothetical protein HQL08_04170 [Nitrospirae bacterium]|nr:hypothetical protein [Nitrospirota bacterium]